MGGPAYINGKYYNEFNNFFKCRFNYDCLTWNSSEQLYQALKFKNKDYQRRINEETDTASIWAMGQSRNHRLIDNFEEEKVNLMFIANYEKFRQNSGLKNLLVSTYPHEISMSGSTQFWNNKNAEILTKIRELFVV